MSSPRRNSPPQQEVEGGNSWARHRATPTTNNNNNNNNSINRHAPTTTTLTPRPSAHHSGSGDAGVMKTTPAHHHHQQQEHRGNTSPSSSPPRPPASTSKTTIQSLSTEVTRFQELRDKQLAKLAKLQQQQQQQQQPLADQPYQQQHHHSHSRASPRAPMVPQQQLQPIQNLQRQDSLAEAYPDAASPSQQRQQYQQQQQQEPSSPTNEDSIAQTPRLTLTTLARHHEAMKHQPRRPSPQARNNNENVNDMFDQQPAAKATTAPSAENASSRAKKFVGQVNDVVQQLTKLQRAIEDGVNVVAAEAEEERKASPLTTHMVVASSPQKFVPDPHLIIDSTQPIETQLDNSVLILTASISHLLQQFEEASQTAGEVRVHQLRETIQHIKKLRQNVDSGIEMADHAYSSPHSPRRAQVLQELEQTKKDEEEQRLAEQERLLSSPTNARRRSNTTTGLAAEKRKLDEVLDEEVFQLSHGIRHLVADVKWITEFVVDTHADDRTKELVDLEATLTESKAQIEEESSHHSPVEQRLQEMGLTVDEWKEAQAELQNAAETSRSGFQGKKQSHVDQLREIIQDRANLRKELEDLKFEHAELLKSTCREKEFDERKLVEVDNVAAHRDLQLRFASTKHVLESVNAEEHLGEKLMQLYQDKKKQDEQIQSLKNELAQLQSQSSVDSSEKDGQLQQALKSNKQFKEDLEKIKKEKEDNEAEADVKISDLKLRLKLTEDALANAKKQRDKLEQEKDQTIDDMRNDIAFSQREVRDVKIEKTKNENAAKAQIEDLEEKLKDAAQEIDKIKSKTAKREQELHEKIALLEKEMEEVKQQHQEVQEKNIKQEQARRNNETASEQERREQQEVAQNEINKLTTENTMLLDKVSQLQNNLNENQEKFKNEMQDLHACNERTSAVEIFVRSESEVRRNVLDEENDERMQKIFEEFGSSKKILMQQLVNEDAKQQETERESAAFNKERSKTERALRNEKAEGKTMKQMFVLENFVKQEIELRGSLHQEENDKRSNVTAALVKSIASSSSSNDQARKNAHQQELEEIKQDLVEAQQSSQILSRSFVIENFLRKESESRSIVVVAQENEERFFTVSQFLKTLPIQQQKQQPLEEENAKSRELLLSSSSEIPHETLKRSEQALREMFVVENLLHREVEGRNAVILRESAEIAVFVAANYETIRRAHQKKSNEDLIKAKQEYEQANKSLESRIAELEEERSKLLERQQQKNQEETKTEELFEASQRENQKQTDKLIDLEKQLHQLQQDLESQKKCNEIQISETEQQIRQKDVAIAELREQLKQNTQQTQVLNDHEESANKKHEQELAEQIKKHEQEKKQFQDQCDQLKKDNEEMKKNLDKTRQELEQALRTNEKIEQEKVEGLKSLHDQQQQKEDSDKKLIQDELALLQQQNEQAIEELKKKLETEQNAEIEALKKQHEQEKKQLHDETEQLVSNALNAKINDKNEQIKQIHQELDKDKENSHLKEEKIAHLEAEIASAKSKNSDSNQEKEKEVSSLKQQLQEAQDALLKQQLESHDRETELNSAITKLKEQLANVQEQQSREETAQVIPVDASKQRQLQLDGKDEQHNSNKNSEHELKVLAEKEEALLAEIKRLQENFDREKKSLQKDIAAAHDEMDAEKLAASKAKIELNEKLEECQNELAAARQDASDAHNHAKELADLLVQTRDLLKNNEEKLTQDNEALQKENEKLRAQIEKLQEEIRNDKQKRQQDEIERAHHQEQQKAVRSIPADENNNNNNGNEHLLDDLKQQHEAELQQTKRKLKEAFDLERAALREMFLAETLARQESEARTDLQENFLIDSSQDHHKIQTKILQTQAKIVEDTKIQLDSLTQELEQQRKSTQVLREEFLNENHLRREGEMRRIVEQSENEEFISNISASSRVPPQQKTAPVVETTSKIEDEDFINSLKTKNQQLQDEMEKMKQLHNNQLQQIHEEAKKIEQEKKSLQEQLTQTREEALSEKSSLRAMFLTTHMEKTELDRRINNVLNPQETEMVDVLTENVKQLQQMERDHHKQQQERNREEKSRSLKNSDDMNEQLQKQEKEIELIKRDREALRSMFLTSQIEHTESQRRISCILEPRESELVEILKENLALTNQKTDNGQNNQQQMEKKIQSLEDQLDEQIKKENTLKLLIAEALAREKIGRDSLLTILDVHQSEIQQRMNILNADKSKAKQSSDKAVADEKTFYRKRVRELNENDKTLRDIFLIENFFCREISSRLNIVEEENLAFVHGILLQGANEKSKIHQNELDSAAAKLRSAVAAAQNDQSQQEKQANLKKDSGILRELFLIENLQHREGQRRLSIADEASSEMFGILIRAASRSNKKLSQVANSRKEDVSILRDMFIGESCMRSESEGRAQIFNTQNEDFLALVVNAKTQQGEKDRNLNAEEIQKSVVANARRGQDAEINMSNVFARETLLHREAETRLNDIINSEHAEFADLLRYKFSDIILMFESKLVDEKLHSISLRESFIAETVLHRETQNRMSASDDETAEYLDLLNSKILELLNIIKINSSIENNNNNNKNATVSEHLLQKEQDNTSALRESFLEEIIQHRETKIRAIIGDEEIADLLELLLTTKNSEKSQHAQTTRENSKREIDSQTKKFTKSLNRSVEDQTVTRSMYLEEFLLRQECEQRLKIVSAESSFIMCDLLEVYFSGMKNSCKIQQEIATEAQIANQKLQKHLKEAVEESRIMRESLSSENLARREVENRFGNSEEQSAEFLSSVILPFFKQQQSILQQEKQQLNKESLQNIKGAADAESDERIKNLSNEIGKLKNTIKEIQQENETKLNEIKQDCQQAKLDRDKALKDLDISVKTVADLKEEINKMNQEHSKNTSCLRETFLIENIARRQAEVRLALESEALSELLNVATSSAPKKTLQDESKIKKFEIEVAALNGQLSDHQKDKSALASSFLEENLYKREAEIRNGISVDALFEFLPTTLEEISFLKNQFAAQLQSHEKEKYALTSNFVEQTLFRREAEARCKMFVGSLDSTSSLFSQMRIEQQSLTQKQSAQNQQHHAALLSDLYEGRFNILQNYIMKERDESLWTTRLTLATKTVSDEADFNAAESKKDLAAVISACDLTVLNIKELDERNAILMEALSTSTELLLGCFSGARRITENENELAAALHLVCDKLQGYEALSRLNVENEASLHHVKLVAEFVSAANLENVAPHAVDWVLEPVDDDDDDDDEEEDVGLVQGGGGEQKLSSSPKKSQGAVSTAITASTSTNNGSNSPSYLFSSSSRRRGNRMVRNNNNNTTDESDVNQHPTPMTLESMLFRETVLRRELERRLQLYEQQVHRQYEQEKISPHKNQQRASPPNNNNNNNNDNTANANANSSSGSDWFAALKQKHNF